MICEVTNTAEKMQILDYRDSITVRRVEFSEKWLNEHSLQVLAAENTFHLPNKEAQQLAEAFNTVNSSALVAVLCDLDFTDGQADAYTLDSNAQDLEDVAMIFAGRNFLLYAINSPNAVLLMSTFDFKFTAGELKFLTTYDGPLEKQKQKFRDFVDTQCGFGLLGDQYEETLRWALGKMRIFD